MDNFGQYLLKRGLVRNILLLLLIVPMTALLFLSGASSDQPSIGLPVVLGGTSIVVGIGVLYTRKMISSLKDNENYEENERKVRLFIGTYAALSLCFISILISMAL